MSLYTKKFEGNASNIETEAIVFPGIEVEKMNQESPRYFTNNALWDTGAQMTVISPKVVEALGLQPYGKGALTGIGGDNEVSTYRIHVVLPNGYLVCDVEAYCSDIEDDLLIGMDVINLTDFAISNTDGNTVFNLRAPSEGITL